MCKRDTNMAAALGLGLGRGVASMSIGTSGVVATVHDRPVADPSGTVAGFADAAGGFLPLVCTLNAAKVLDTVAALIGLTPAGRATVALLRMNRPVLVQMRRYWIALGLHPPQ